MYRDALALWVLKMGSHGKAIARLIELGLSTTLAEKLVHGTYKSQPRGRVFLTLKAELALHGITLPGEPYSKSA